MPVLKSVFGELLGCDVTSMKRIHGGRNSQVYLLTCGSLGAYVGKAYFRHGVNDRDRVGAEFSALRFLWKNRVRCVPQPIAVNGDQGYAVYQYIDGSEISPPDVTTRDIDYAVWFLARLKQLKDRKGSRDLQPASEACFSAHAIVDNIQTRLDKLYAIQGRGAQYGELREFLARELLPSFKAITKWCRSTFGRSTLSFDSDLGHEERTLSPSDFGFHNAMRLVDGRIIFLDFEYFGWDDPAKMISDFLLHPAMELEEELKHRFVSKILNRFADYTSLDIRVKSLYPLFGIKWCLILLNEFVPEHLLRRRFASESEVDTSRLQVVQLSKARRLLQKVMSEYERFPYECPKPENDS